jgi:ABC-2 type transport system permease protein
MIGDIITVVTKEWREFFASGSDRRSGLIIMFIIAAILGFYLPFRVGQGWITSPFMVLSYSIYLPLILVINTIADSIAGERERHTLETLLASRLSDRAIIFGKLGAVVGYSLAFSVITALIAMVAANLHGDGSFQVYSVGVFGSIVVFALLVALLLASVGVLVSLRASSVRQAQVMMSVALIVVIVLPLLIYSTLSDTVRQQFIKWLSTANWVTVGEIAAVLIIIDLILIAAVTGRFQRSRLILS